MLLLLVAGLVLSLFGSLPPGLISLSVAQTSIARGWSAALALALGAAFAEYFQALAAVLLSDWFMQHPTAERWFHWAAMPVFFALGIYLIFFAKPSGQSGKVAPGDVFRQFYKGLIISAFNLLAVPYWFVYCAWLRVEGWWIEGTGAMLVFALGVSVGTMGALALYAWLGQLILRRSSDVAKHANRFIGLIFIVLGMKLLWELLFIPSK